MALIECHECKTEMSSEAAACPKCGAPNRQKSKTRFGVGTVVFWIVVAIGGLLIVGMIGESLDPKSQVKSDVENAKYVCQNFVTEGLKTPTSAKFPDRREFTALPGRAQGRGPSPAAALAIGVPGSSSESRAAAVEMDRQLNFLTLDEYKRVSGGGEVTETVKDAMIRKFEKSDYVVSGQVDAQNAFGAMLRSRFLCLTSRISAKDWHLDGLLLISR